MAAIIILLLIAVVVGVGAPMLVNRGSRSFWHKLFGHRSRH